MTFINILSVLSYTVAVFLGTPPGPCHPDELSFMRQDHLPPTSYVSSLASLYIRDFLLGCSFHSIRADYLFWWRLVFSITSKSKIARIEKIQHNRPTTFQNDMKFKKHSQVGALYTVMESELRISKVCCTMVSGEP